MPDIHIISSIDEYLRERLMQARVEEELHDLYSTAGVLD